MRIVQITPGAGDTFYCENCLRDKAAVVALRRAGHDAVMVPLYLPPLGELDVGAGGIFFGGINVYLQQKLSLFRRTPRWLDRLFDSPRLLRWAGRRAGMTNARDLAETTLSMLRGEHGRQAKELDRLVAHLTSTDRPDVVVLSNVMLIGMAGRIRRELAVPVVCLLQDEDTFLDSLDEPLRTEAWATIRDRLADVDVFVAVSRYYAGVMRDRLGLAADRLTVVHWGIDPADYPPAAGPPDPPAVGFLSRMSRDKGLDLLVEAFIALKRSGRHDRLKLRLAGGRMGPDEKFIAELRRRIDRASLAGDVTFLGDFSSQARREFLGSLSVLSVPERTGEALGLYVLEALAAGVPVVQPANGASPELLEATGGGILCEPDDPHALAEALGRVLSDGRLAAELGGAGRRAVLDNFTIERVAADLIEVFERVGGKAE